MNSTILQLAVPYIRWIFLIGAIIILIRGHNYPGGGFIGGLLAGLAILFEGFACNMQELREQLGKKPQLLIGFGLFTVILSTLPSLFIKKSFMTGIWVTKAVPLLGNVKLGTPFLFDIGVFLVVIGITLLFLLALTQNRTWK
jgi:multicomponent Na+:H+ antiporter subunit B